MATVPLMDTEARGELRLVPLEPGTPQVDHTEYTTTANEAMFVESVFSGGTPGDAQV